MGREWNGGAAGFGAGLADRAVSQIVARNEGNWESKGRDPGLCGWALPIGQTRLGLGLHAAMALFLQTAVSTILLYDPPQNATIVPFFELNIALLWWDHRLRQYQQYRTREPPPHYSQKFGKASAGFKSTWEPQVGAWSFLEITLKSSCFLLSFSYGMSSYQDLCYYRKHCTG